MTNPFHDYRTVRATLLRTIALARRARDARTVTVARCRLHRLRVYRASHASLATFWAA